MRNALKLAAKVATLRVPPRALLWVVLNKVHEILRTGNTRFAFERLYVENRDPWDYQESAYEQAKYRRALACLLNWCKQSDSALEIGCSIGVFSKLLAPHFEHVTSVDVSREVLRLAAKYTRPEKNIRFVGGNLRTLDLGRTYDVITCAEVLYYIAGKDIPRTCRSLERHLSANGIVLVASLVPNPDANPDVSVDWEGALNSRFKQLYKEIVRDSFRPYPILIYGRKDS